MSVETSHRKRAWSLLAGLLLLSSLSTVQISSAQQQKPSAYRSTPYQLAPAENHKLEPLRDKVDLPDLPTFTGKARFMSGNVEQGAKGGPRYSMIFEAEEPQSQVVEWYDNVFRMYKWKNIQKSTSSVSAMHKDGHFASVSTNAIARPGASSAKIQSSFTLHYQMAVR